MVTTTVLPLETERNVDCESEGVGVGLGGGVGEEVEKVVEVDRLELDWLERVSEIDDGGDVELLSEVVVGGRVVDEVSPGVVTGVELRKDHQMSNFHHRCRARQRTLTAAVGG